MKACPVMLHQATVGLVKANTGEGREHHAPSPTPTTPTTPLACFPAASYGQPSHGISVTLTPAGIERFVLRTGKTGRKEHERRGRSLWDGWSSVGHKVVFGHIAVRPT